MLRPRLSGRQVVVILFVGLNAVFALIGHFSRQGAAQSQLVHARGTVLDSASSTEVAVRTSVHDGGGRTNTQVAEHSVQEDNLLDVTLGHVTQRYQDSELPGRQEGVSALPASLTSSTVTPHPHRISVEDLEAADPADQEQNTFPLFTEADALALPPDPEGRKFPVGLIVGSRKAGTGALRDFLSMHPHVKVPFGEPGFFGFWRYELGLEYYRNQLPVCHPRQLVVEKSAEYFHEPLSPMRVHAFNSSIKLILIVRDPYVRMLSDYLFLERYTKKPDAPEKKYSIQQLLKDPKTKGIRSTWGCIKRSVYYVHMRRWLYYFPRKQILIVDGDEFSRGNPGRQLSKVERFLGLMPYLTEDMFYFNQTKHFYCSKRHGCLKEGKGHSKPELDPVLEQKVRDYFRPYNLKFFEQVGRTFDWK